MPLKTATSRTTPFTLTWLPFTGVRLPPTTSRTVSSVFPFSLAMYAMRAPSGDQRAFRASNSPNVRGNGGPPAGVVSQS